MIPNEAFIFFIPANPAVKRERLTSRRLQSFELLDKSQKQLA